VLLQESIFLRHQPINAADEQLFSSAGQLYTDSCRKLKSKNTEKLLFLT